VYFYNKFILKRLYKLLASLSVLLLLSGVSVFLMGLFKLVFPSAATLIPEGFKRFVSLQSGVIIFLVGLLLVRFF